MPARDLDEFRAEVEACFQAHLAPAAARGGWGSGPDDVAASGLGKDHDDAHEIAAAKRFQRALFDAGLAWITGPVEHGGAGLGPEHARVLRSVARQYATPDTSTFMIGQQIVAPAIAAFGSNEQRDRYLAALWSGEVIGCQLFSEPDAGSDLASLRCRAVRDGDGWRITGQKVWSSGAHLAGLGELLTRTDPEPSSRHKGLTMFLIDMHAPGVTVAPLRQMNGNSHFNEVFLEDVWVPHAAMLGSEGQGWAVANASLTSEREVDPDDAGLFLDPVGRLVELARHCGVTAEPVVRQRLASAVARERIGVWLTKALPHSPSAAPVAASITKLYEAQSMWAIAQDAAAILGARLVADDGEWGHWCWSDVLLGVQSLRIAGGTDEIQRNIIGERGLGMPREARP